MEDAIIYLESDCSLDVRVTRIKAIRLERHHSRGEIK